MGHEEAWLRERMERHLNPSGPFEVARQDGRWIRIYEQRLPNNGIILIISDITESKRVDQALRESEERFRAVVDNSPAKIHIKDAQGHYILINPLAEELFGVTETAARGKTSHDIFPKEQADAFTAHDQGVLANKAWRELNREVIETTKPGARFEDHLRALLEKGLVPEAMGHEEAWLRERMERHLNPSGPFEVARQDGRWIRIYEQRLPNNGIILIISDITESKRADQALSLMRRIGSFSPTKRGGN